MEYLGTGAPASEPPAWFEDLDIEPYDAFGSYSSAFDALEQDFSQFHGSTVNATLDPQDLSSQDLGNISPSYKEISSVEHEDIFADNALYDHLPWEDTGNCDDVTWNHLMQSPPPEENTWFDEWSAFLPKEIETIPAQSPCNEKGSRIFNEPLKQWLREHSTNPYPNLVELEHLAAASGKSVQQTRIAIRNLRCRMNLVSHENNKLPCTSHILEEPCSGNAGGRGTADAWEEFTLGHNPSPPFAFGYNQSSSPLQHPSTLGTPISPVFSQIASLIRVAGHQHRKGKRQHATRKVFETNVSGNQHSANAFPCTTCHESFKSAFTWKRHMQSVHWFTDTVWVCMLDSTLKVNESCVFCSTFVTDMEHFKLHNIETCSDQIDARRLFSREDYLKQHVREVHLVSLDKSVQQEFKVPQAWRLAVDVADLDPEASWCGFCQCEFKSASERMKHVQKHLGEQSDLKDWVTRS